MSKIKVMIAGIGGASLGTELCKALNLAGRYDVYGCDVSPMAYGLYDTGFVRTDCVDRDRYVADVLALCLETGVKWIIPGGEQPMVLLGAAAADFMKEGITVLANDPAVIGLFSDKKETFEKLAACGVLIPRTVELQAEGDVGHVGLPCIVKPATGTGGSASVFFAVTAEEAMIYAEFIRRSGSVPIAQEYVSDADGEFTVGVLSLPNGSVVGSIALRRVLDAKLSVAYRGRGGIVSSGYSQGMIDHFPEICKQAENIARLIDSRGPINIQGRLRDGVLMPFEINPRFSASTYLRAMAGFNEVDMLLGHLALNEEIAIPQIRPGLYLRSLTETFVPKDRVK